MQSGTRQHKYMVLDEIEVPDNFLENWQSTVDLLAEIAAVPSALIMRLHESDLEVFLVSRNPENVYRPGDKLLRDAGYYCETVINSRRKLLVTNALRDPTWDHNPDLQHGMISYCGLPLTWPDGELFGTICVLDKKEQSFPHPVQPLMERFRDSIQLSLGEMHRAHLQCKQAKKTVADTQTRLLENMLQTVEAIAGIIEMRDPYTSGHQVRVADLAMRIAQHMGLPDEQIQAIHLAGVVHDLGKISVPAELLSKPTTLNDVEFSLIKMHSQSGFNILKGIDFKWPIAQMVYQHHERFDGSGYPQGLKGDEIMLGARILSVADVVEAMSSHRPYRPALGIDTALDEIIRGRGKRYDAQVVDTCEALFRTEEYVFPKSPTPTTTARIRT